MNVNKGLPEGFFLHLVKQKFPSDRPIFWGPDQQTKYPDTYNEPKNWKEIDMMRIPVVYRFITGGKAVSTPFAFRTIYLGSQKQFLLNAFYVSDMYYGYNFEIDGPDHGGIAISSGSGAQECLDFQTVNNIATLYGANKSSFQVIDENSWASEGTCFGGISKDYLGPPTRGTYNYVTPLGTVPIGGSQHLVNIGGRFHTQGVVPNVDGFWDFGSIYEYASGDTEGNYINRGPGEWRGDQFGHIQNGNKLWRWRENFSSYWFLRNEILGSLPSQTNILVRASGPPDQFPGSTFWDTIILPNFSSILANPLDPNRKVLSGLILHP